MKVHIWPGPKMHNLIEEFDLIITITMIINA